MSLASDDSNSLKARSKGRTSSSKDQTEIKVDTVIPAPAKGLSFKVAAFFIVAQLAGAGFVSLPSAVANTGWLGLPMMIIFCTMVALAATNLGECWIILEKRWPEEYIGQATRQPYMEMAHRSFGIWGRRIATFSVLVAQFGGTTVFIVLTAQMANMLIPDLSTCEWVLIVGAFLTPFTWLGTPKDFWVGPVVAVVSTIACCAIVFVQTLVDIKSTFTPVYNNPTLMDFALGFGTILFAYGGSSVFPTIQNDMTNRSEFSKSVRLGFLCILSMYFPISAAGYIVFGSYVDNNILFQVTQGIPVKIAMALQIINLLGSYLIGFNTVSQAFEDFLKVPTNFNWKRIVTRTFIVVIEVTICLALPDFSLILNLIGGSAITICTFILPPLMYLQLTDWYKSDESVVPLWKKCALTCIALVGIVGGVTATWSAISEIISTPFSTSCFLDFAPDQVSRSKENIPYVQSFKKLYENIVA